MDPPINPCNIWDAPLTFVNSKVIDSLNFQTYSFKLDSKHILSRIEEGKSFSFLLKSVNENTIGLVEVSGTLICAVRYANVVILVHGFMGSVETFSKLTTRLDLEHIPYENLQLSPTLGDPKTLALDVQQAIANWKNNFIDPFTGTYGYNGKFDIVCHSMGAITSRWYMQKLAFGLHDIETWIGIAPVIHGAGKADFPHLLIQYFAYFFNIISGGNEEGVKAMKTDSDTLSQLNYNLPHFNGCIWRRQNEILSPNVTHKVIVGIKSIVPNQPKTLAANTYLNYRGGNGSNPSNCSLYHYTTYWGDGWVPIIQGTFFDNNIGTDCFVGLDHNSIHDDPAVIDRVVAYLKDPTKPSLNNLPPGKDPLDKPYGRSLPSILQLLLFTYF